jgi:hypothetical protein
VVTKVFLERRAATPRDKAEDQLWLERARANKETSGITIDEYRRGRGLRESGLKVTSGIVELPFTDGHC